VRTYEEQESHKERQKISYGRIRRPAMIYGLRGPLKIELRTGRI
jgi:hypothetical protein